MVFENGDLIVVNRNGIDYRALIDDLIVNDPGDGKLSIKDSDGATVGEFTANQAGDTDVTLPKVFSGDYNDLINQPDPFPEAPADGNVYVRNGQSKSWIRGLPYDIRTLPELP